MSLDLSISTRLEGESEPVVSKPSMGTVLRMELFFKLDSGIEALQKMKLEHLTWLAWESRRAAGLTVPTWAKFSQTLEDMDFEQDDAPLAEGEPPTSLQS
jgi:hypothetical protein